MPALLLASPNKCRDQGKFLHDDPAATAAATLPPGYATAL